MSKGLHTYISDYGVIASMEPIDNGTQERFSDCYETLMCQLLLAMPVVCVRLKDNSYPALYPGVAIVPEREWGVCELEQEVVLMNEVFIEACLGKSTGEASMADLMMVLEMLTDNEKLIAFGDVHGLIVGGC